MHPLWAGTVVNEARYVPRPDGGWLCLDCDLVARRKGYSTGSASRIIDREGHDDWHTRQPFGGLAL